MLFRRLSAQWDVIVLLVVFAYLFTIALDYRFQARQFPITFLVLGILALLSELFIEVCLPDRYRRRIKYYTTGISTDVEKHLLENVQQRNSVGDLLGQGGITRDYRRRIYLLIGLIVGYGVLAYIVGIILSTPFFVFATIYFVGSQNLVRAITVTVVLLVVVFFLFGELMNTPIFEGVR